MSATDTADTHQSPPDRPQRKLQRAGKQRSFPTFRAVSALMLREMVTTYGRSPGGYIWAVIAPVAGIAVMSAIFSTGFRNPPLGSNFPIFYATGLVPFMMFLDLTGKVNNAINYSRSLLEYPAVSFLDAIAARLLLAVLTQAMVAYLIFTGIRTAFDTNTTLVFSTMLTSFGLLIFFSLAVGTMNCFLFSMYPVWQSVWSVITRPLFIISGIFFLHDFVPQPYRDWLWWNPLVHIIGLMRRAFYTRYEAAYVSEVYVLTVSGVVFTVGLLFLYRYHRDILNR